MGTLPVIEEAVDDGVVHGRAHGQPHDTQVDLLDEELLEQVREELMQQEVDVVGQPAGGEGAHHYNHHLHHLEKTDTVLGAAQGTRQGLRLDMGPTLHRAEIHRQKFRGSNQPSHPRTSGESWGRPI